MQNGIYFKIDNKKCIKCGMCVACCPFVAINQEEKDTIPEIDKEKCEACGVCQSVCSIPAIDKVNEKF